MKREKRLTKKERKEQTGGGGGHHHDHGNIHCIACGRHLDPKELSAVPPTALIITCQHGSQFPSCTNCEMTSRYLVAEHDKNNKPVNAAPAYH
jgi:hypothetical protein